MLYNNMAVKKKSTKKRTSKAEAEELKRQELEAEKRKQAILDAIKPLPDISKFNLKSIARDGSDITDLTKYMLMKFPHFKDDEMLDMKWTPHQLRVIDSILNRGFKGKKRIHIMASTRFGKSASVAAAVLMRVAFLPEKWAIVAGTNQQAQIIMHYIIMYATDNPLFRKQLEIPKGSSIERLKRERNKRVLTFNNGGRVGVLSAQIKQGSYDDLSTKGVTGVMGEGCIPKGYKVLTDKGEIEISELVNKRTTNEVYSYNHKTNKVELQKIEEYQTNELAGRDLIEIDLGDRKFVCTEDHPVWVVGKGYIKAGNVKVGDKCLAVKYDN